MFAARARRLSRLFPEPREHATAAAQCRVADAWRRAGGDTETAHVEGDAAADELLVVLQRQGFIETIDGAVIGDDVDDVAGVRRRLHLRQGVERIGLGALEGTGAVVVVDKPKKAFHGHRHFRGAGPTVVVGHRVAEGVDAEEEGRRTVGEATVRVDHHRAGGVGGVRRRDGEDGIRHVGQGAVTVRIAVVGQDAVAGRNRQRGVTAGLVRVRWAMGVVNSVMV